MVRIARSFCLLVFAEITSPRKYLNSIFSCINECKIFCSCSSCLKVKVNCRILLSSTSAGRLNVARTESVPEAQLSNFERGAQVYS